MSKKKLIGIIIVLCLIALTLLIILIKNPNKNENKSDINNYLMGEGDYDNTIIKEHYEYNEFNYQSISTEQLLQIYLNDYRNNCLTNAQVAYELLNEEYRKIKFPTLNEYIKYLSEKKEEIKQAKLNKYSINNYSEFKEYIIQDQFGNYYIFNVTAVMEYTICLDTYTVPTTEFIEKYNKASNEKKAGMNLNRFLESIKEKDYNYAYGKLAEEFKSSNFETQAKFENYINKNWLEYENIETVNVKNQVGIYECIVKFKNINSNYEENTFIIQLEGSTDYKVAFTM